MSSLADQKNSLFQSKNAKDSKITTVKKATTDSSASSSLSKKSISDSDKSDISTTRSAVNANLVTKPKLSEAARRDKLNEAQEHYDRGMKYLKKTVFQWVPDYLGAAPCFEKAANAYKIAGEMDLAHTIMLQSANSHESANCLSAAAVTFSKSAQIAHVRDLFSLVNSVSFYQ